MPDDYPAAHSMDTRWFAVDSAGHIATFDSGEAGAVPHDAMSSGVGLASLRPLLPTSAVLYDLRGFLRPGRDDLKHGYAFPGIPLIVFLSSPEPVESLLSTGRAVLVQAIDGVAAIVADPTQEDLDSFTASPHFRAFVALFAYLSIDDDPTLAQFGFFDYHHLCENWISGPYGRQTIPAQPIHLDQLPPEFRKRIGAFRIDQRFADTVHLQPVEFAECASRESAYLDVTGKHERPMPGQEEDEEDDFDAEEYDALADESES